MPYQRQRKAMPASRIMSSAMMMVRVRRAFLVVGSRKALTPLETASTPVMAVQPLEKTLRISQREIAAVAGGSCGGVTTGVGCPPLARVLNDADQDDDEQRDEEEISGNHEGDAGVVDAAQVDDGQKDEDEKAEPEGVLLQAGYGGDERADSGRDANGGGEDVVDHQCGGGEKPRPGTEIFGGNGVGATALRVSSDRLAVGEVDDDQQDDDGRGDGNDEVDTEQSEGDEQRQSGFRTVSGGAESVEAEDGNASERTDLLPAFVRVCERLSKQQISKFHADSASPCGF